MSIYITLASTSTSSVEAIAIARMKAEEAPKKCHPYLLLASTTSSTSNSTCCNSSSSTTTTCCGCAGASSR